MLEKCFCCVDFVFLFLLTISRFEKFWEFLLEIALFNFLVVLLFHCTHVTGVTHATRLPVTLKGSLWSWGIGSRRGQKQRRGMRAQGIWTPCTLWLQVTSTDDVVQHTPFTTTPSENFSEKSISIWCWNNFLAPSCGCGIKWNKVERIETITDQLG